ncbi:ketoacyl-ACP synthase III [Shewanella sp. MBTL60-007]|uniref:ketoacyl-ACP synthase III n=1 Tax=Shewanella sp. MBTL60-007 TaxID=2815911 RepID=UPI001BBF88B0|nr:ketoacyl-ACP synthase III [Shewanella sp. MBTL60-007]GIU32416.1 3-oxoacyl-ACP synthase [Shewanella sp. MBTL60-007]
MITISNVSIKGIATTVPSSKVTNSDLGSLYGEKEIAKLISSVGVNARRVADTNTTSADLCYDAAVNLINELKWAPESIGAIIFVSQTGEYQLPATACILQNRLGLPVSSIAYDVNLGCSGYTYGLFLASSLVQTGIKRVLLLVGDTISKLVKPGDRSTELLFGDAGTATGLEFETGPVIHFELGSDGSGAEHIIARKPQPQVDSIRGLQSAFLEMNGGEVFTFTLKRVPLLVNGFLETLELTSKDIDSCVYHQANHFMIKHLSKKSKFEPTQVPVSITEFGNTSCASIPLTLCTQELISRNRMLLVGFGVGLSWGAVMVDLSTTKLLPVNEIKNQ